MRPIKVCQYHPVQFLGQVIGSKDLRSPKTRLLLVRMVPGLASFSPGFRPVPSWISILPPSLPGPSGISTLLSVLLLPLHLRLLVTPRLRRRSERFPLIVFLISVLRIPHRLLPTLFRRSCRLVHLTITPSAIG